MAFDYKKECKELYLPKAKPALIEVPEMNYVAIKGVGDPNKEDGEYKKAVACLYAIAYTIKMSKMSDRRIEGYFDFVVPPLEGFWWQGESASFDYAYKEQFSWISMIRLPDFVTEADFNWAVSEATRKKGLDLSKANMLTVNEGLCVQCMHIGSFDDEPKTVELMNNFISENGLKTDINEKRHHHEIYLSDPRKTDVNKLKTVIRIPVKRI